MKSRTSQISRAAVTALLVTGCAIAVLIAIQSVRAEGAAPSSNNATRTAAAPSVIIQAPGIDPQILWTPVPCRTLFAGGPQAQAWELRLDFSGTGLADWCLLPQHFDSTALPRYVPRIGLRGGFVRVATPAPAAQTA
jgi:hypothetical protein